MGCSAGVISIHLASDLLQVYKKAYAVVVSTENITQVCVLVVRKIFVTKGYLTMRMHFVVNDDNDIRIGTLAMSVVCSCPTPCFVWAVLLSC